MVAMEKINLSSSARILLFVIGGVLICIAGFGLMVCVGHLNSLVSERYLASVEERIAIGDDRSDVIPRLSDAWYHGTCWLGDDWVAVDTFLYDPRNQRATVIYVYSIESESGELVVDTFGILDESSRTVYGDCLPPDLVPYALDEPGQG